MPPKFSRELKDPIIFHVRPLGYQLRTSPCEVNCPAGNAIQRTHYLIQNDRFDEALETLKATNPFPGITGRVCHHPCETHCNRSHLDESLSIRALERAASEHGGQATRPTRKARTGKGVAIIGSGPGGLTCAYYLALLGHDATIFEALPFLGGIPRVAIPDYHLPKDVVDMEVVQLLESGVKVRMNTKVGRDISFEEVAEKYDACLIAAGAWRPKRLDIPGSERAIAGIDFLMQANVAKPAVGEKVVVVGGGGVGVSCACTALRLGAAEVHVACPEPQDQMLACPEHIEQAQREGVVIHNSQAFTRILSKDGRVAGIECLDIRSFEFDEEGKLKVDPVVGSEHIFPTDMVIAAIGEAPDLGFLKKIRGLKVSTRGTLEVDPMTLATGRKGVFAAGDVVTGPSSVAEAIGSGRRAAISIDSYLRGERLEEIQSIYLDSEGKIAFDKYQAAKREEISQHVVEYEELTNVAYFEKKGRVQTQRVPFPECAKTFEEIDGGYRRQEAQEEAGRCCHCGHCFACGVCVDVCPGDVLTMVDDQPQLAYPEECYHCGACLLDCPASAIGYHIPLPLTLATYAEESF